MDQFIKRCIVTGEPPLFTLDDALDALRLIEAAERSVRLKRSVPFAELTSK
jgi:predicted dehydrogenase